MRLFGFYENKLLLGRWNYVKDSDELKRKIYLIMIIVECVGSLILVNKSWSILSIFRFIF